MFGSVILVAVQGELIADDDDVASLTVQEGVGDDLSNTKATGKKIFTNPDVPKSPFVFV